MDHRESSLQSVELPSSERRRFQPDWFVLGILLVAGGGRVWLAIDHRETFGVEATVALFSVLVVVSCVVETLVAARRPR